MEADRRRADRRADREDPGAHGPVRKAVLSRIRRLVKSKLPQSAERSAAILLRILSWRRISCPITKKVKFYLKNVWTLDVLSYKIE